MANDMGPVMAGIKLVLEEMRDLKGEMRDLKQEMAEMHREAAEDRKQAAEDRRWFRQFMEKSDRRERDTARFMATVAQRILRNQENHSRLLERILKRLEVRTNGA